MVRMGRYGTRMGSLGFNARADAQLTELGADHSRRELFNRINDALDAIEDDPSDASVRRLRYQRPPIWGIPVYGSGEDWLILWSESESGAVVHYIGESLA